MKQQQINEAISAWFEPKPTKNAYGNYVARSPKGAWIHYSQYGDNWQPLNYFTDEAANARLLEAMPQPLLERVGGPRWRCEYHSDDDCLARHQDRKTAVVLAFCKFAGIDISQSAGEEGV